MTPCADGSILIRSAFGLLSRTTGLTVFAFPPFALPFALTAGLRETLTLTVSRFALPLTAGDLTCLRAVFLAAPDLFDCFFISKSRSFLQPTCQAYHSFQVRQHFYRIILYSFFIYIGTIPAPQFPCQSWPPGQEKFTTIPPTLKSNRHNAGCDPTVCPR